TKYGSFAIRTSLQIPCVDVFLFGTQRLWRHSSNMSAVEGKAAVPSLPLQIAARLLLAEPWAESPERARLNGNTFYCSQPTTPATLLLEVTNAQRGSLAVIDGLVSFRNLSTSPHKRPASAFSRRGGYATLAWQDKRALRLPQCFPKQEPGSARDQNRCIGGHYDGQGYDSRAFANEARRAKERGGRRLGLSDRADRGSRGGGYRLCRRLGRRQFVGSFQSARSHDGRDAGGLQGGPPRRDARAGELRFPLRPVAGGVGQRGARGHPPGQGGRRRHGQAR